MYSNYIKNEEKIPMNEQSKYDIPQINFDDTPNLAPRVRKQKGWGHWSAFLKSKEYTDLIPGNVNVTEDELARHNKPGDIWIALSHEGRIYVYDVTLFAEYHPGGYEILESVAGRDATQDFRVAHAYVNPNMISRFQKGFLVRSKFSSPNILSPGRSVLPPVKTPSAKNKPRWDWTELEQMINFTITPHKVLLQGLDEVTVQYRDSNILKIRIFLETEYYFFEIQLNEQLEVALDTLEYNVHDNKISIKMKNNSTFQLSHLGGIVEDKIVSIIDAVEKEEYFSCTLIGMRDLNSDCREFTIQWPFWVRVGVPMGHHVILKAVIEGDIIQRPYTPVCSIEPSTRRINVKNQTTLMIKRYQNGKMSSFMHTLDEDSEVLVSLPTGSFKTPLWINIRQSTKNVANINSVVFIAAGSGITPMIRLMLSCFSLSELHGHLVFFNRKFCDIIYKEEFESLERFYPSRLKIMHVLSQPDSSWVGLRGRITEELCQELFVSNFNSKMYLICGPSDFNKTALKIFQSLRVPDNQVWEFKG